MSKVLTSINMPDSLSIVIASRQPDKLCINTATLHEGNITVAFEDAEALLQDLAKRQEHDGKGLMSVKSKGSKNTCTTRRPCKEGRV